MAGLQSTAIKFFFFFNTLEKLTFSMIHETTGTPSANGPCSELLQSLSFTLASGLLVLTQDQAGTLLFDLRVTQCYARR